jgi:hypothetical protein
MSEPQKKTTPDIYPFIQAILAPHRESMSQFVENIVKAHQAQINTFAEMISRIAREYELVEADIEHIVTVALGPVYSEDDAINRLMKEEFPDIDCKTTPTEEKRTLLTDKLGCSEMLRRLIDAYEHVEDARKAVYDAAFLIINDKYGTSREEFDSMNERLLAWRLEEATGVRT